MSYPPASGYRPPHLHSVDARQLKRRRMVIFALGGAVAVFLFGGGAVWAISDSEPEVGDCLASLEDRSFGGLEIVDCGDSRASYEVVEKAGSSLTGSQVCQDHTDGEVFKREGRKTSPDRNSKASEVRWEICAEPVD